MLNWLDFTLTKNNYEENKLCSCPFGFTSEKLRYCVHYLSLEQPLIQTWALSNGYKCFFSFNTLYFFLISNGLWSW